MCDRIQVGSESGQVTLLHVLCAMCCVASQQISKGKVLAVQSLRDCMLEEAGKQFPELIQQYR